MNETDQATLLGQEYNKLLSMQDVEAAIVHTLRDAPLPQYSNNTDINYGYGWLHQDRTPKPVFCDFSRRAGKPVC